MIIGLILYWLFLTGSASLLRAGWLIRKAGKSFHAKKSGAFVKLRTELQLLSQATLMMALGLFLHGTLLIYLCRETLSEGGWVLAASLCGISALLVTVGRALQKMSTRYQ